MSLAEKKCIPYSGEIPVLPKKEILQIIKSIDNDWELTYEGSRLLRKIKMNKMEEPMKLANLIATMADEQWHHPELHIGFGHLDVEIWTHKINGLVESDFIFAAKVDQIIKFFFP